MKTLGMIAVVLLAANSLQGADLGELIFADDFERVESQEQTDEPGNGWKTNSRSRAKGNKQVDLRDGAMYVYMHPEADHAVSVTHPAEFTDGAVALRFKLEGDKDNLGLDFADLDYKPVHAGHLFVIRVSPSQTKIMDLKTGNMNLEIREARQAGTLTSAQKKMLASKQITIKQALAKDQWHDLLIVVEGDQCRVTIDGQLVGEFSSAGFAHPTKKMLRLSVPGQAYVDDVKVYRKTLKKSGKP